MAEVIGQVVKKEGDKLFVNISLEACNKCSNAGHCRLFDKNNSQIITIEKNEYNLEIGDYVEIGSSEKRVLVLSFFLYMFPVIMFLFASLVSYKYTDNDITNAIVGLGGALFSFVIIKIVDKKLGKNFKHNITRVIK